jgi:putative tricarboxylic transport membrane protein
LVKTLTGMVYRLSKELLIPTIGLLCLSGAYSDENAIFSIWVALIAGVVGYVFRKLSIPHAPIILALVLGRQIEDNFSNSLTMSQGDWSVFVDPVNHPISLALVVGAAFFMLGPVFKALRQWARKRWPGGAAESHAGS